MKINLKIRFWDILLTSVISLFLTTKCYGFLYNKVRWNSLTDFYTGVTIYNDHNKYLDIYIYLLYLLFFFICYTIIYFLTNRTGNKKDNEKVQENIFTDKIKAFFNRIQYLQYFFVLGFLFLHPFDGNIYPKLTFCIAILMILSFYSIYRSNKKGENFSPLALTALFFIFCFSSYSTGTAPTDDHHFGEKFPVFLMHNNFNMEYYKDVMLVHGLRDVTSAWLGNFFFNQNNIHGYCMGEALHRNIIFIITMLSSLFIFGKNILYSVPLLLLQVPSASVMSFGIYSALIKENILNKPAVWFWLYFIFAILFSCYWTTIGTFWIIASLPAFLYICKKLKSRKIHITMACLLLFILSIIFRNSFFEFLHQAQFYVKGTLFAFGNDFSLTNFHITYKTVFEWSYKMFALFFVPVLILETIKQISDKTKNANSILFLVFPIIFVFSSLTYTMGRLDNGTFQRLEFISFPFLCIVLPYWFYKFADVKLKVKFEKLMFGLFILLIIILCTYSLKWKINQINKPAYINNTTLFNVGNIELNTSQEKRLTEIKNSLYERSNNETFLDLTNRGMHYLYFNKEIPVLYTSFYNSITSKQAIESVERLKKNPPENILVFSNNIIHDNVFPSLRINALYRWIFLKQNYKYKRTGENVFLVKSETKTKFSENELSDLDYYFAANNLKYLPEVWAKSLKTLPVIKVMTNYIVQIYGDEIKIKFINPEKIENLDLLHFKTNNNKEITNFLISINGSNSQISCSTKNGNILVPLDNFPSWLLNDHLTEITVKSNRQIKEAEVDFYNRIYNHMP